ncbi:MAG: BglII/BstYI family type II restriction endonuclease [Cellulophaga sp.]|uniref:BglII/BstYI family type II restriction endonuclease n=1 Tax=Cellulophaga sp. TaxID=1972202 RepID=UPI003263625D
MDIENWLKEDSGKLKISKQYFHHHAYEIMNTHDKLRKDFKETLSSLIEIKPRIKLTKGNKSKAIEAGYLNKEIRRILTEVPDNKLKLEVSEERGVFYFSENKGSIGGFDFAIINHSQNINALRNLCFGELRYHNGLKRWNDFLSKNPDLKALADSLINIEKTGNDLLYKKTSRDSPLIVGEIQFGNWALAYRDFFKVLKANVQNSVDCLIYIVPTGNLEAMLSGGIVTFDKTKKILEDFAKVISVPVWIIGLDID